MLCARHFASVPILSSESLGQLRQGTTSGALGAAGRLMRRCEWIADHEPFPIEFSARTLKKYSWGKVEQRYDSQSHSVTSADRESSRHCFQGSLSDLAED
jgi:hypothetical protein